MEKDYDAVVNVTLQNNKLQDSSFVEKDEEVVNVSINYSDKNAKLFQMMSLSSITFHLQVFITLIMTGNQTASSLRQQKWTKYWFK